MMGLLNHFASPGAMVRDKDRAEFKRLCATHCDDAQVEFLRPLSGSAMPIRYADTFQAQPKAAEDLGCRLKRSRPPVNGVPSFQDGMLSICGRVIVAHRPPG
jgi:hypothetical protein